MTPIVQMVFDDLRTEVPGFDIELEVTSLPDAFADPSLLKQVFITLISNAIKFGRLLHRPIIAVEGQLVESECAYSISDKATDTSKTNGAQILPSSHESSYDDLVGPDVGLSIVRRILERHGGRLSVNAATSAGARFTFSLPEIR